MLSTLIVMGAAMQSANTNAAADAWTDCLVRVVERNYRTSASTDAIVDKAMRGCAAQEINVRRGVERDFGNYSAAEVSREMDKLSRATRSEVRGAVVRLRGQQAAPAPARPRARAARVSRPLEFFNKCRYPVRYFVYHIEPDGKWRTHGWYTAGAHQPAWAILDERRRPLQHLEGERLYSYAETTGKPFISWHGKGTTVTFAGARYSLQQSTLTAANGKYQFGINCAGR